MLNEAEIFSLQEAWLEVFQVRLTDEQALAEARALMQVFALLIKYE